MIGKASPLAHGEIDVLILQSLVEVLDVAAFVDAGHTMAEHAIADIQQRAGTNVGRIILHALSRSRRPPGRTSGKCQNVPAPQLTFAAETMRESP
jgi:hypothetical protein